MRFLLLATLPLMLCSCKPTSQQSKQNQSGVFATDFNALGAWSEQAQYDIHKTSLENPIRGNHLKEERFNHLRKELMGKSVRWEINVTAISPAGSVALRSYHTVKREMKDEHGRRIPYESATLMVRFQDEGKAAFDGLSGDTRYIISGVSESNLRNMTVGNPVTVVGTVKDVKDDVVAYVIEVRGASIE